MPKVSIIVPVYDVAEYLRRCIDSCVYQTLADIEVIIVNDSSPDNRDEVIISEYERNYPEKVRVFRHEKNLGLGEARNTAIQNAQGEFLLFCDSDDFLDFTACEKLYCSAKQNDADLVVCDYYYMRDGVIGMRQVNDGIDTVERSCRPCVLNKTTVWVIMLKKSIVVENGLLSPFRFGEDNVTVLWYLAAKKIAKVDEPLYYYVYRETSLIGSMNGERAKEMANVYYDILQYEYYKSLDIRSKAAACFLIFKRFFGYWLDVLMKYDNIDLDSFFRRILDIENTAGDYRNEILKFDGLNWEILRTNKILAFAEKNLCKDDFNRRFLRFYDELDQELAKPALMQLKQRISGRRIVLWAAGSYGSIFEKALKSVGFEFEVTDLIVKENNKKVWDEVKSSTDIVLLPTSEFKAQVKKIIGSTEMIVLQKYLNDLVRIEMNEQRNL